MLSQSFPFIYMISLRSPLRLTSLILPCSFRRGHKVESFSRITTNKRGTWTGTYISAQIFDTPACSRTELLISVICDLISHLQTLTYFTKLFKGSNWILYFFISQNIKHFLYKQRQERAALEKPQSEVWQRRCQWPIIFGCL